MFRTLKLILPLALALMLAAPATSDALLVPRSRACPGAYWMPATSNVVRTRIATTCLVNYERSMRRLPSLIGNAQLGAAALGHSRDMVERHYFSHETLTGASFVTRILATRYVSPRAAWTVGENIGWASGSLATPAAMVAAWMRSPGHRANILKAAYREVGVGMALGTAPNGLPSVTYTTDFGHRG